MNKRMKKKHQCRTKAGVEKNYSLKGKLKNPHSCKYCCYCYHAIGGYCMMKSSPCSDVTGCEAYFSHVNFFKIWRKCFKKQ